MSETWRCFVGVPLGEELRRALGTLVDRWRDEPDFAGLRWTDPDSWHVTLAFLGSVEVDRMGTLGATLREVAAVHAPMRLPTGGLGGFPRDRKARVLWYGILDPDRALGDLARGLNVALGVDAAEFRPHVTLARARREPVSVRALAERPSPEGPLDVDHVDLMRSHLGRGPARYERLDTVELGVTARV